MTCFSKFVAAIVLAAAPASVSVAQPFPQPFPRPVPQPFPQPFPQPLPQPFPQASPVDGRWFFRGDPLKPCFAQTVPGPRGPFIVFTNEQGTQASGWLRPNGREVTIPGWNLTGTLKGDRLVWPNGDYWQR